MLKRYNDTTQSIDSAFANELQALLEDPFKVFMTDLIKLMTPVFERYQAKGLSNYDIKLIAVRVVNVVAANTEAKVQVGNRVIEIIGGQDARSSAN